MHTHKKEKGTNKIYRKCQRKISTMLHAGILQSNAQPKERKKRPSGIYCNVSGTGTSHLHMNAFFNGKILAKV